MRIGSRRIIWTVNCMLLLAAALIFRPIRSWIDQVIIAKSIHPNLSVQEIHLHVNRLEKGLSVVEARQFDWGSTHGNRHFGISAERAWIVVENASLIDKSLSVPKAVLEHSKLYLDTIQDESRVAANTDTRSQPSIWQQHLNDKFGDIQWQDLKEHLDGVLRLNEFSIQCQAKVDGWVQSSQRIAAEAKQLRSNSNQPGNPLRDNADLHGRLVKIDQLIESETNLRAEFTSLDGQIESKIAHIDNEHKNHLRLIKDKVAQQKSVSARILAKRLVEQTGRRFSDLIGPYAEVADLLCRATSNSAGFGADENYRAPDRPLVMLNNISATGVFGFANSKSPFSMQSSYEIRSKEPFGSLANTNYRYQFDMQSFSIKVLAASRTNDQPTTELQIEVGPQNPMAVDARMDQQPEIAIEAAQWVVRSNGSTISGQLNFDQHVWPLLAEGNEALSKVVANMLSQPEDESKDGLSITVDLSGSWQVPIWQIDAQSIPDWLVEAVNQQLEQHYKAVEEQLTAQLERHISSEVDRLAAELNQHLDTAKKHSTSCSEEMIATKTELNKLLSADANTEFARSNQDEVKR